MIQVNKIGQHLFLASEREEVLKRFLGETLKVCSKSWLQAVFTGLPLLLSLLSTEPYVFLKCENMKLEKLLRKFSCFPRHVLIRLLIGKFIG